MTKLEITASLLIEKLCGVVKELSGQRNELRAALEEVLAFIQTNDPEIATTAWFERIMAIYKREI